MANRYHDRPFSADDAYDRGDDPHAPGPGESDPLAELARLIGQTDPFSSMGRANQQVQPRGDAYDQYQPAAEEADDGIVAGPPPWMQRAVRHEAPQHKPQQHEAPEQDYPSTVHPLHRYAQHPEPQPGYDHEPAHEQAEEPLDPSRYDDALYGQIDSGLHETPYQQAYSDDPYAYQDGDEAEDQSPKRRGGLATVVVVLALAVVGTGAAYAYRTYVGSPRSGEPPIIKADTSPTKIVPAPGDGSAKLPDRLATGDGTEKIVPREEAPIDVNANTKPGPRMVFPPLNQNANPPSVASVAPNGGLPPASGGAGTLPNNEPRKIKTLSIRGDEADTAGLPAAATAQPAASQAAAKAAAAVRTGATTPRTPQAPSAGANTPMSLTPQAAASPAPVAEPPHTRVATNTAMPIAPSSGNGGYLVQVSSQRNEADAQASYRVLQGKFPTVLGSRTALIRRADLGEKGVYYRAMVGPFGSPEEASQFCGSLKTAGGQCVVQRN
jgi:SPOR domain